MDVAVIDWKDSKFEKDILYEDFNAPQWIDFSSDDRPVDDEAWFCKPECNHPKTVEDFFRQRSPGSSKFQRSASVSEISQLGDRNRRDAALKKRGYPRKKDSKCSKQLVQDSENQNPNFTTPPTHKSKPVKEMIKSSSEKNHGENMLPPTEETARPRLLKSTLSAHNLFAGREILNQVTEFCNELKRLATRTKEGVVAAASNKQEMGILMESKSERKPLLEVVKKEKFEEIEKQSNVKEKIRLMNTDSENSPIPLNMKNIRGKDEARVLQIRTNPPSPQCFSATTKATPSKAFRLRPQEERGMVQEIESKEVKKEVKVKVKGSNTTIQNEAKGLDVFWFLKPCTLSS